MAGRFVRNSVWVSVDREPGAGRAGAGSPEPLGRVMEPSGVTGALSSTLSKAGSGDEAPLYVLTWISSPVETSSGWTTAHANSFWSPRFVEYPRAPNASLGVWGTS